MPLDIPLLSHNLEQARELARRIVHQEDIDFTPHSLWDKHFERALHYLESKEAKNHLKRFTLPVASPYIETLIRRSLGLPDKQKLENTHLQESVVSALLCPLRQVVGSCFATAPAIFIQREQPERLLLDLHDLMMLGQLKRTFAGQEFAVPISPKWGERFSDHPLLRVWEYTLASFSDYKTTFSSWNLYKSLGLDPKNKGGIGALIYSILQEKLDDANKEVEKLHSEYVRAIDEARVSQALLRQADSPDRMRMRKGELEVRKGAKTIAINFMKKHNPCRSSSLLSSNSTRRSFKSTFLRFMMQISSTSMNRFMKIALRDFASVTNMEGAILPLGQ